jgi:hypothetical protein
MAGKRLLLRMSGPGGATIDGTVEQVSAQLSGSGSLEGRQLQAARAEIDVRGPGSAAVNVEPKADKRAARAGSQLLVVERNSRRYTTVE